MSNITRTTAEIVERVKEIVESGDDFFGAERGHLIFALPFEEAKQFLTDDATESSFTRVADVEALRTKAKDYMGFAVEKMLAERGLSANRSVDHYKGWIWLLTDDETYKRYDAAEYGWYGRNQLRLAAEILGFSDHFDELVTDDE